MLACVCQSSRTRNVIKNVDALQKPTARPKFVRYPEDTDRDFRYNEGSAVIETKQPCGLPENERRLLMHDESEKPYFSEDRQNTGNGAFQDSHPHQGTLADEGNGLNVDVEMKNQYNMKNGKKNMKKKGQECKENGCFIVENMRNRKLKSSSVKYTKLKVKNGHVLGKNEIYIQESSCNSKIESNFLGNVRKCLGETDVYKDIGKSKCISNGRLCDKGIIEYIHNTKNNAKFQLIYIKGSANYTCFLNNASNANIKLTENVLKYRNECVRNSSTNISLEDVSEIFPKKQIYTPVPTSQKIWRRSSTNCAENSPKSSLHSFNSKWEGNIPTVLLQTHLSQRGEHIPDPSHRGEHIFHYTVHDVASGATIAGTSSSKASPPLSCSGEKDQGNISAGRISEVQPIPDGGDLTINELREMATRQQQQIETQQQLLVAREQRLKYLKQQEGRSAQVTMEAERLRRLRERVEAQEAKLRRLRALRGQVDSSRMNAASLSSDLDAMRHLFSEKEKELVDAAAKVEELTRQLEDVRTGRVVGVVLGINQNGVSGPPNHLQMHHQELDKLRRELLYRNSINRESSARILTQKEALNSRKDEIARIDKRIAELQQRLHRKRLLNKQLASQISAATQAKQAQLKAVQQKALREGKNEHSADGNATDEQRTLEDLAQFDRGKHDPKYQTLPYNTKFSSASKGPRGSYDPGGPDSESPPTTGFIPADVPTPPQSASTVASCATSNASSTGLLSTNSSASQNNTNNNSNAINSNNSCSGIITRTVHSIPTHLPSKGHASAPVVTHGSPTLGAVSSGHAQLASSTQPSVGHNSLARGQIANSARPPAPLQQSHPNSQAYQPKTHQEETSKQAPHTVPVSGPNQECKSNLPPTSLSVSFVQKLSPGVTGHGRATQPSANQLQSSVNKDVENVRALGYPAGSAISTALPVSSHQAHSTTSQAHFPASTGNSADSTTKPSLSTINGTVSSTDEEGSETTSGKLKPVLPPKPVVPSKPTPPPRQKGDPMASSTESLHLTGVSHRPSGPTRSQVFRYASQNVILSTYTQQQQITQPTSTAAATTKETLLGKPVVATSTAGTISQVTENQDLSTSKLNQVFSAAKESGSTQKDSNASGLAAESSSEKVHISINRRIEMPPDFLFPEDATPPSDLLGQQLDEVVKAISKEEAETGSTDTTDKVNIIINNNNNISTVSANNKNINNNLSSCINNFTTNNNLTVNNNVAATINEIEKLRINAGSKGGESDELKPIRILNANNSIVEVLADLERRNDDNEKEDSKESDDSENNHSTLTTMASNVVRRLKKGNLKTDSSSRVPRRVSFDPLALLLDASLEGELELVKRTATEVPNPSAANDEGITALHNAICAGHLDIVTFLVTFGCDVNAQDSDGWTPLHCAASCNNVAMVRFLVEHGACVLATTLSDHETAAEKCEQDEEGYDGCSQYLYSVQEKLGIMNGGVVYAVYDYDAQNEDELSFKCGDPMTVIRRGDEYEREWWWVRFNDKCGYVPRNLLGLYPRVKNPLKSL